MPADISFEAFQEVYRDAYRSGCKGCTTYRPNAITGSVLEVKPGNAGRAGLPPAVSELLRSRRETERRHLQAALARQRARDVRHHQRHRAGGVRRPFEVFVNSKNLEHYAWVVALTRMISAVFRRGGEVAFVAEELKQVFDPRGGQWTNGRYVGSLVAAIGDVIERHMIETGFLTPAEPIDGQEPPRPRRRPAVTAARTAVPEMQPARHWSGRPAASAACIAAGPNAAERQDGAGRWLGDRRRQQKRDTPPGDDAGV